MKNTELTLNDVKDVLSRELLIGSDNTKTGKHKKFTFSVWDNCYIVYADNKEIDSGQAIEELLNEYNDL